MKKLRKITLILSILSLGTLFSPANADIKVVASIKPIHSLAGYLMDGVAKPDLIVDGYASPHGFSMKPSHANMLQNADLIFWVGKDLENFLAKSLSTTAKKAKKIELMSIKGLTVLEFREKNIFDKHAHHKEKEKKHADHKEKAHDGHAHGKYDPHIWLDPINAKVILQEMNKHLIEHDANNASKYQSNYEKALVDIDKLTADVKNETNIIASSIVFHDAYQYFEKRFNVKILGTFTVNTDIMPGAQQLSEIRKVIERDKVSCVFSEPQFNPNIIKAVADDMNVKTGVLDPLGAALDPGKDLYFKLIRNMSFSFKNC